MMPAIMMAGDYDFNQEPNHKADSALFSRSQEEEFGLEACLGADEIRDLVLIQAFDCGQIARFFRVADACEQVGDLVRIHARSGHLDWASPIEVVVAESEDQLLELKLRQVGLVHGDVEMGRLLAPLCAPDREEEKVEFVRARAGRLDELRVDKAATRRVAQSALPILNEEGLNDPLVDNHESDLGLDGGLIVHCLARVLELGHLCVDDLCALTLRHTIAEDDDIGRIGVLVVAGESFNSLAQALLELRVDDFLALFLDDEVGVVLRHLGVGRRSEADD
eukprot:CAMPEP_0170462140 /NCGR_PEP_ID=MMETSP0123-20130129/7760_1 /TAXON_ID=182087 /ORGANISM="Favella ehrenbergii, Strain Fehren 1" /LENGTH=278 /DNA_ID=CAMNT_0010727291 /DNA_START=549 /DNA_END=1386 /DNA_ORIENTATION=+